MKQRLLKRLTAFALIALMVVLLVPVFTFGASAAEYTKATSIAVGDTVVFVCEGKTTELTGISTTSTKYGVGTEYTGTPAATMVWTVEEGASEGTFAFKNGDNYLYWTSGNSLNVSTTLNANTSWTATFDGDGNVVLANAKDSNRQIAWNNGSPRFACYTSKYTGTTPTNGYSNIQLYKLAEAKHEHSYAWNGEVGVDGLHTLACANADGKCDATTTTEECTWVDGSCSVCGAEAPACEHINTPTTTEVEIPATCTEIGYTAGVKCDACNQYISGHDEIEALGHNVVTDAAVAPTCTATGLTEGSHCTRCDEMTVAQTEVPATGHTYVDGACNVCGETVPLSYTFDYTTGTDKTMMYGESEGLITLVYDKASGNTQATWYANGTALRFYKNNELTISTIEGYYIKSITLIVTQGSMSADSGSIAKDGNTWTWTLADGNTTKVAFTPSDTTKVQQISIELAKTCTHENTEAIGEAKDATCTEDGITAGEKCADCGEVIVAQETIDATGHSFVNGTCSECGEAQCTEHTWVDGDVITEASCTSTGLQAQHCEVCGQPNPTDKELPMLAHTPETDAAVTPTCTATGLTEGSHCSVCNEVLVAQTVVDMVDHDYVDNKCTVCGDIIVTGDKLADFQFGENGNAGHKDGTSIKKDTQFTSGSYILKFGSYTNVYDGAFDAKGNSALKLGSSSKAGSFTFTVGENVKTVVLYVAGRTDETVGITVNGVDFKINTLSDNGEYTKVVIDTTETKTVEFKTTTNYRAMINSIEFWGEDIAEDTVGGYTVTLGDNIGVNFHMELTGATLNDEGAYMLFTLPNGATEKIYVKDIKDSDLLEYNGKLLFKFTAPIAVKEMANVISAQMFTAEGTSEVFTYTVQEYTMKIITEDGYSANEKALAKALLNYGANAQLMFGYNTDKLVNSELDEADKTITDVTVDATYEKKYTDNVAGVTFRGTTTMWEADTAIRFYFDITGENVTFKLYAADDTFIEDLEVMTGGYGTYVTIDGIVAKDMATTYKLVVSNGAEEQTIEYSVYSYFYDLLASDSFSDIQKTAIKAAFIYSQTAITYFSEK